MFLFMLKMTDLSQLLYSNRPVLYLHSSEKYFPSSIDFILQNSFLQTKNGTKLETNPLTNSLLYDKYKDISNNN